VDSLIRTAADPPGFEWAVLLALTILAGSFTLSLPSLPVKFSVSETFIFTAALLCGPAPAALTITIDILVISFWRHEVRRTPTRFLFNLTAPAIAIRLASEVFFWLPGTPTSTSFTSLFWPVLGLSLSYFALNTLLIAGLMAAERGSAAVRMWRRNLPAISVNYLVGGFIAMFVVSYINEVNIAVLGIVIPVLLVSYLTLRTSIGRLEDANRHVSQISDLYLSTIEALAMAVDAKDQITHGHIRRVQVFATQLAHKLGVHDEAQLRAIETAALLHDMGKLAIPEFILNKPGKLTVAEFEKMKRHADIGADLLSSISFPYPVIPIVRHHHENWNGTGYPSKLSGHDIPLGARILSVVDCFDALTSDRPYRPRMSDDDSFRILRERSGSMYDPLIVDTFIQVFPEIAPAAIRAGQQARSLVPTFSESKRPAALELIRTNAAQSSILGEFGPAVTHTSSLNEAMQVTGQYVGLLTPATVCALFLFDAESNSLTCVQSVGDDGSKLQGLSIPVGERTTGWAAAHETVMANSPASLDLEERAEQFSPPLKSALVAPLMREGKPTGALSVYATIANPFNDDHKYAIERVAAALVERIELDVVSSRITAPLARNSSSGL
jgi:putative nucleotidyltransferase with HDIG domain